MRYWNHSDYKHFVSANRMNLRRIFYTFALVSLGLDYCYNILISQIGSNPILDQDVDPVYLFFMWAGIPDFITGPVAPYFDALLIGSCIVCLLKPRQTVSAILFLALYFTYFIVQNMISGHHYTKVGLLIMATPFVFARSDRFANVFAICRLFLCFMMFSAACWKVARGNLGHPDQVNMLLITTHLEMLIAQPDGFRLHVLKWLITNKLLAHFIWIVLICLEASFLLGFLSLRWDRMLLVSYLLFFAGGWLLFNIYNFENLALLFTLTPFIKLVDKLSFVTNAGMNERSSPENVRAK